MTGHASLARVADHAASAAKEGLMSDSRDEANLAFRMPASVEEENRLAMQSVLQLATVIWAKVTRKLMTRGGK
jgi:hypothetical protein